METTLHVNTVILRQLIAAAQTLRISRSDLIIMLLKKLMNDISRPSRFGRMVQYQERNDKESWKTVHLTVREDDYEYLLDLRKLLKMSVSRILAFAVKKYLGKLNKKNITDKNHYKNYVIIKEFVNNIVCWRLFWGYPPNIERFLSS
ncbi:MAG: hypothetical protein JXA07_06755 [Spirochaetes bacterium]|nr:hypothetical protein [Spirochaetota bacterium]